MDVPVRGDRGITTGLDIVKGFQDEDYCRRLLEATVWRIVVWIGLCTHCSPTSQHDNIILYKVISAANLGKGHSDQDSIPLAPCRMEVFASSKIVCL